MKRILITGVNSYVGNSFEQWLERYSGEYEVDKISMKDDSWKQQDLSKYDTILHVAGIAHVSKDPMMEDLYYRVNRDLTIEVAKRSKAAGVKQFIFMSSIIVYGDGSNEKKVINRDTVPQPSNFYGNSKLQAEEGLKPLENDEFKIVVIRPPMIYGKDSKGNYPRLAKAARKLPVFPNMENKRSMLHIDNLSEFIRLMVENKEKGLFFPQNKEYVRTSEMVRLIAQINGKKIRLISFVNPFLRLILNRSSVINKVFGNLVYEKSMSKYKEEYAKKDFESSIKSTENINRGCI